MTSVQLYQTANQTIGANGKLAMTFGPARVNRVWIGTLTITGLTSGTALNVAVDAQTFGQMFTPGPSGPWQLISGQRLTLAASGLTNGTAVTAILAGADIPKDQASPWLGPTLVQSVALGGP